MSKKLVSDELWAVVEPLLPPTRPAGTRGHPPVPNRVALSGIIFVLKTGLPWEYFPQELGCCGGLPPPPRPRRGGRSSRVWSAPPRRSASPVGARGAHAAGRPSCTPTR